MNNGPAFNQNEDRYRRLREQGVTFWTPDPEERSRTVEEVFHFFSENDIHPESASLIEFGCGEGFLAEHLLERGYRYTGVDFSPSTIDYARKKYGDNEKATFIHGDVTDLKNIPDNSFDAGLDIMFLHMLVEDEHREKYLAEVRRVLKPAAPALFTQAIRARDTVETITGVSGLVNPAGTDDSPDTLPRIPARFNNEVGYAEELEQARFIIERLSVEGQRCIIHLRTSKE